MIVLNPATLGERLAMRIVVVLWARAAIEHNIINPYCAGDWSRLTIKDSTDVEAINLDIEIDGTNGMGAINYLFYDPGKNYEERFLAIDRIVKRLANKYRRAQEIEQDGAFVVSLLEAS